MGVTHSIISNQKPYKDLIGVIAELHDGYVKSGFPDSADVGKATKNKKNAKPYSDMSEVARVAAWNEFGTDSVPARPFFRNAIDGNKEKILDMTEKLANEAMIGKSTVQQAFDRLGLFMQGLIRASIRSNTPPPNSPKTIAAKGSSKTLIDSGQMINSVTYVSLRGKHAGRGVPEVA